MTTIKAYLQSYDFSELGNNMYFGFGEGGSEEFRIKLFKDKEILNKAFSLCSDYVKKELKYEDVICTISFSQDNDLEPVLEDINKI